MCLIYVELVMLGGLESVEVIMWFIMCGVMLVGVNCWYCEYYLFFMIGIVVVVYELVVLVDVVL